MQFQCFQMLFLTKIPFNALLKNLCVFLRTYIWQHSTVIKLSFPFKSSQKNSKSDRIISLKTKEMAPPAQNETLHHFYVNHTVDPEDIPLALCASVFLIMVVFFGIYAYCCLEAMKGKFDFVMDRETKGPLNTLKFVNPWAAKQKRKSSTIIVLDDDLNCAEASGNHTDTETC